MVFIKVSYLVTVHDTDRTLNMSGFSHNTGRRVGTLVRPLTSGTNNTTYVDSQGSNP